MCGGGEKEIEEVLTWEGIIMEAKSHQKDGKNEIQNRVQDIRLGKRKKLFLPSEILGIHERIKL